GRIAVGTAEWQGNRIGGERDTKEVTVRTRGVADGGARQALHADTGPFEAERYTGIERQGIVVDVANYHVLVADVVALLDEDDVADRREVAAADDLRGVRRHDDGDLIKYRSRPPGGAVGGGIERRQAGAVPGSVAGVPNAVPVDVEEELARIVLAIAVEVRKRFAEVIELVVVTRVKDRVAIQVQEGLCAVHVGQ